MRTFHKLIAVGGVAATALAVTVVPAIADPPSGTLPPKNAIVGVGSDTIQFVFDQFSSDYNKTGPSRPVYSWDAVNPKTGAIGDKIVSKKGCAKEPRPNGSTGGLQAAAGGPLALGANLKDPLGGFCTDFSRSSRPTAAGDPSPVDFIPFATDAVTYATNAGSNAPADLTTTQLNEIYSCTVPATGGHPANNWADLGGKPGKINAQLPQAASGTRKFFLGAIGVATPGSCVGSNAEENEGVNSVLKGANTIFPYSVADYIAQVFHSAACLKSSCAPVRGKVCKPSKSQNAFGCDVHGRFQLNEINATLPTIVVGKTVALNPNFSTAFTRLVFAVVRGHSVPGYLKPFFGPTGWLLTNKHAAADICAYGFSPLAPRAC
jgi:ABC-type phosphate transport system substrate-binding protein